MNPSSHSRPAAIRTILIAGVVGLAAVTSACSVQQTVGTPWCQGAGSLLLVAQSVPTASQVPCLEPLPEGWQVVTVNVNQDRTVVTLDSDRAGEGAAVLRFEEECDVTGAVQAPTDQSAAVRYDAIVTATPSFEGERFYTFPGGCVRWAFDFDSGTSATEAIAVAKTLVLNSRVDLIASVRESFVDEEF